MSLKVQFNSLADFWLMSGHGVFVWSAYAITFFILSYLLVNVLLQRRALIRKLRKAQRLQAQAVTSSSTKAQELAK